jgi:hypothetical protein
MLPVLLNQRQSVATLYLYANGENHFIRARETWKTLHGPRAELDSLAPKDTTQGWNRLPFSPARLPKIGLLPEAKFFWDFELLNRLFQGDGFLRLPSRAVYFSSFSGKPS